MNQLCGWAMHLLANQVFLTIGESRRCALVVLGVQHATRRRLRPARHEVESAICGSRVIRLINLLRGGDASNAASAL